MNELSSLFQHVTDNATLVLQKDKTYHVRQDDSFVLDGYYCSNSAQKTENPSGRRYTAIYLKEKKNILLDGNGATLLIQGKMTPLVFDHCENITLRNLTIDYACPTMAEFTVISNDNGNAVLQINPECRFRIDQNELFWQGELGLDGTPYWEDSYQDSHRLVLCYNPIEKRSWDLHKRLCFENIEQLDPTTLRVQFKDLTQNIPAGTVFQTRNIIRDQVGALFQRCKNLHFENLRIKFMHGLGLVSQFCENITFYNCDLTPGEGRTIASTADFFQFSGCKGNIILDGCKTWGAQDDHINVHGTHLRIIEKNEAEQSILVRFIHAETWGFQAFSAGDEIEFIKWDTLIPYANAKVLSFKRVNDTDILLYLDKPLPQMELNRDVAENSTYTPNLYVRNCDFSQTSCRGILCTTRGEVIIENNRFYHIRGPVLVVEDDCNFWFESGYTRHIVFRNNHVIGCAYFTGGGCEPIVRYTPQVINKNSTAFVHGKLTLTDNIFEDAACNEYCIRLEYLKEADIKNNHFDAPYSIKTVCTGRISEENNQIIRRSI